MHTSLHICVGSHLMYNFLGQSIRSPNGFHIGFAYGPHIGFACGPTSYHFGSHMGSPLAVRPIWIEVAKLTSAILGLPSRIDVKYPFMYNILLDGSVTWLSRRPAGRLTFAC